MTPFYVRVTLTCGARGLYFERGRCVQAATELEVFRELEWPVIRQRLLRQGLAYRVFVSPRDARIVSPVVDAAVPATACNMPKHASTEPGYEQRLMTWGR